MLERISRAAEELATRVSESRRGFLVAVGQAALGIAGAVGGLLALPTEARAAHGGYCQMHCTGYGCLLEGWCVLPDCTTCRNSRCFGTGDRNHRQFLCNQFLVSTNHRCSC
jgi:hypothetical protein